jgi:hypothetical protein
LIPDEKFDAPLLLTGETGLSHYRLSAALW